MRLYRKASYGRLAELILLDTRQYRTDQPNGDRAAELNETAMDPKNTLLGAEQEGWLKASLLQSTGTWNVLAQQVMMGLVDQAVGEDHRYSMDQWPGAAAERMRLVRFLADRKVPNPVVLTGDIHSNWVNDLPGRRPEGRDARDRRRVRRHLDLQRRQRRPGDQEGRDGHGREPLRQVLQRPAGLCPMHRHPLRLAE